VARDVLAVYHAGRTQEALERALPLLEYADVEAEMSHMVGACYYQLGQASKGIKYLQRAIRIAPDNPGYFNTLGVVLRKLAKLEQAVRAYSRVTELESTFADAYYNCGNALSELKRKDEAIAKFSLCLQYNPSHNNAHHNLANIYRDKNMLELALEHYQLSDQSNHDNPDMHCNWGLAYQLKEQWAQAISCFETAIHQKSDHAPSYVNLGGALSVQERFDEACAAFRKGVELDDKCNDAKFNLGLTLLTIGEFTEGWEFYDTRLNLPDKVITPFPGVPLWDGNPDIDAPLMVWAEQGYGDNIQFVRYIPLLIEAGIDVVLSTRKPLMSLFKDCLEPHSPPIVEHKRDELKDFKYHIPLLSLPRIFSTTLRTIPCMPGYLKAPNYIRPSLSFERHPFALNIGIVWASGADNKDMYEDKSTNLESIMPLFDPWRHEKLVAIHSLQVGVDADQLTPWRDEWGVYDWSNQLSDFKDTAMIISQLDLVITVDTAVAHIAGAMDKPTWLMLQHNADFRWLRGRSDTPWYPSMTLIRQKKLGDWTSVFNQVSSSLKQLLG